ncbi:lipid A biosynthesis acyltransferase [Candidatus Binatia bacterium]|nr:lipid A biosynthesis acyltransferase [Candidatus Binatia bacterium]
MSGRWRRFYKGSPRLRRLSRRAKDAALLAAVRCGLWAGRQLGLERALAAADLVGGLLYRFLGPPRRLALAHIELVYGDTLSASAREALARAAFVNVARCFMEIVKIDEIRRRAAEYVEIEGLEVLQEMVASGQGGLIVTGHIGNWELLAAYCSWRGIPVAAVARRIYVGGLNDLLVEYRARQGVETILRESPQAARQLLRTIKRGAVLAMLIDQDTNVPSVSVPFLGRSARTPAGAATFALRRRELRVAAAFIERRPRGGHRITIRPPFEKPHSGDRTEDIRSLTRVFNAALEEQILRHPTEWVWWHRRWRNRPRPRIDLDAEVA